MEKKGDIWISAALYFGLGIVVITLILTAGMPVVNKLRDKNTVIQTKDLMFKLDNNIRDVIRGGAGEQRYVEMEIKKGEFIINKEKDTINWSMDSKVPLSQTPEPGQPDIPVEEGYLTIVTRNSNVEGEYKVGLSLDYSHLDIPTDISYTNPSQVVTGFNKLLIKNNGLTAASKVNITITNI